MNEDLPPEIMDLDDYTESINILCHSDTGGGKTVLWAQLPKVLILSVEEGTISAKRWMKKHTPDRKDIKVWRVKRWDDLVRAYQWLEESLENGTCPFEWVLIDTVTAAQVKDIRAIMESVVENNPNRDPDIPSQGDHFKWQLTMKRMVGDFNELPINVVWLAQSMKRETEDGDELILPLIEGKDYQISSWVCAQMHAVMYMRIIRKGKGDDAKVIRRMYTNNHPTFWVKDRYGVLGNYIDNPDANDMVGRIIDSEEGKPPAKKSADTKRSGRTASAKKSAGGRPSRAAKKSASTRRK